MWQLVSCSLYHEQPLLDESVQFVESEHKAEWFEDLAEVGTATSVVSVVVVEVVVVLLRRRRRRLDFLLR